MSTTGGGTALLDAVRGSLPDPTPPGAADKALIMLSALINAGRPMHLIELARACGLPKSTAHRLVGVLSRHAMVGRHGDRYVLSGPLAGVAPADRICSAARLRELATPLLVDLYDTAGVTVSLAMLDGTRVRLIDRVYGCRSMKPSTSFSEVMPAHCTALGKAMAAHSREASTALLQGGELPAMTPATIKRPVELAAELARVRRTGIAHNREELRRGVHCVAAPVVGAPLPSVAGIAASGVAGNFDARRVSYLVRQAAFALSSVLSRSAAAADRGAEHGGLDWLRTRDIAPVPAEGAA
jgi:DNA-binding IclR family transcriptional regulator